MIIYTLSYTKVGFNITHHAKQLATIRTSDYIPLIQVTPFIGHLL